ncbi:MAG: hypothetical protein JRI96_17795, partial [Deltaproteobacteria bacterium]|nr:hypothetical protein [Deltaproteobacteria bacterium]
MFGLESTGNPHHLLKPKSSFYTSQRLGLTHTGKHKKVMQLVRITEDKVDVNDPRFGEKRLFRGKTYLMHDVLAQTIVGKKWGIIRGDDRALP